MTQSFDVVAIGNAIVDVLGHADDSFLAAHDIPKGGMVLIDDGKASDITNTLNATDRVAGGSAGNSMACLASLGGSAAFVGKVADDVLGGVYRTSMSDIGVQMTTPFLDTGVETGRCLIAVTPDAERSMATFLGAAGHISEADIDPAQIEAAAVTYFEGYLFEGEEPRSAFLAACRHARQAGKVAALTLSDVGVIERNGDALRPFIREHIDFLFANEAEARVLLEDQTSSAEDLATALREWVPNGVITRSEHGSVCFSADGGPVSVPAIAPTQLVDTTGAGDAYAGGFLYGFTRGMEIAQCATLGSMAASEVISHMGPRPAVSLKELASSKGLL